jgi:hypothetical protein
MFFIGDNHASFHRYIGYIKYGIKEVKPDCSLQIGDMGIFDETDVLQLGGVGSILEMEKHKFFRGNHDNPVLCKAHANYLGDYGYLPKQEMFWIAGGFSIDRKDRIPGVTWWEDEELSYTELQRVIEMFADSKPRIVVSHECPTVIKGIVLANAGPIGYATLDNPKCENPKAKICSRTEAALQAMYEKWQPEQWIFGHYHCRLDHTIGKTRFIGLGDNRGLLDQQVFEIPGLIW